MEYCKTCVMPDTKPGVWLDENGRCNACRTSDQKSLIDWSERFGQLKEIANEIRARKSNGYDCIVAVSGGKDSWFQAATVSEQLGLKVLCVTLAAHLPTTEGIANLNQMVTDLNVDHIKITLKPSVFRKIRRKCFLEQGEPNWAEHCAMFSSVVRTALLYEVPLVIWGEDIAYEFGGIQRTESKPSALAIDKSDLVKEKTIFDWLDTDISQRDTLFYQYPDYQTLSQANIQCLYLGHYVRWYGRNNFDFVKERGFQSRAAGPLPGNFLDYDNIDEKLCEINIWFKYLKFGFWRPTDQTCYDIWNGKLTRERAVEIVLSIQDQLPYNDLDDFLDFHMISMDQFTETVEKFRNKDIWEMRQGGWKLKKPLVRPAPTKIESKHINAAAS